MTATHAMAPRSHFATRQYSALHGKGVKRMFPHCYYSSLAGLIPRFVSNRAYLGSFGMLSGLKLRYFYVVRGSSPGATRTRHLEELKHVEFVVVQSSYFGVLWSFGETNLSLYPHPPSTNQRAASQLSTWSKSPATSLQEDHLKPRLPDLLATTNRLHATPLTVKFHQTPSPSSDFRDMGLRTVFTVQMPKDILPSNGSPVTPGVAPMTLWPGVRDHNYKATTTIAVLESGGSIHVSSLSHGEVHKCSSGTGPFVMHY
ncbi:hypothetical protein TNCV_2559701 [Trichonephila clavipes]|nr:hypothetical protein TNCV_2559701 [Trichonephila clavipes]